MIPAPRKPRPKEPTHGSKTASTSSEPTSEAEVAEAVTQQEPTADGGFSMALSQDQHDIREWVHGFAEGVVRPAAAEWDEREETPWPVIQGRQDRPLRIRGARPVLCRSDGLSLPTVNEELFWGDAGIGMSIMGTTFAVAGIFSAGTPEQLGEWVPQCYGTPDDPKVAPSASRSRRRAG